MHPKARLAREQGKTKTCILNGSQKQRRSKWVQEGEPGKTSEAEGCQRCKELLRSYSLVLLVYLSFYHSPSPSQQLRCLGCKSPLPALGSATRQVDSIYLLSGIEHYEPYFKDHSLEPLTEDTFLGNLPSFPLKGFCSYRYSLYTFLGSLSIFHLVLHVFGYVLFFLLERIDPRAKITA